MAYQYSRTLTISHAQCGSTDSTDFPVLIQGTLGSLATVANGGHVQNASGYDLVVTSDLAGTSLLNFERLLYVPTTGQFVLFGKLPTLSHTVDPLFYLQYSNAAIVTDQQNKTGTWEGNFHAVYHLGESTNPYGDSTTNANNSNAGTYPTQVAGLFGNAQSFASASSQYIQAPGPTLSATTDTVSGWIKVTTGGVVNVIYDSRVNGPRSGMVLYIDASNHAAFYENNVGQATGSTNLNDGAWHHLVGVFQSGTGVSLYVDGSFIATTNTGASAGFGASSARIGASSDPTILYAAAVIQEVRVAVAVRSADWILAEYNNHKSGSTFLTIGPEVGSGDGFLGNTGMDGGMRPLLNGGCNG